MPRGIPLYRSDDAYPLERNGPAINTELVERIVKRIKQGSYPRAAAEEVGVPACTFDRWMVRGRYAKRGRYQQLHSAVMQATHYLENQLAMRVLIEAKDDVRAAQWWLTHGPPKERWAAQAGVSLEVGRVDGGPGPVVHDAPPPGRAPLQIVWVTKPEAATGGDHGEEQRPA